nr:hypothetical protein [Candidatus Kryptobacter tengchongensis]
MDWDALVPDKTKSIKEGAIYPWRSEKFSWFQNDYWEGISICFLHNRGVNIGWKQTHRS